MSRFYTETHDRGMVDLSESAAPGNLGLPWLDPCIFSPDSLGLLGPERRFVLFFPSGSAEVSACPANQREQKDAKLDLQARG